MKNKFGLIILILLALSLMLTLSSCDIFNAFSSIEQCVHIDTDDDFKCDRCEESFNDGKNVMLPSVPPCAKTSLSIWL